MTTIYDTRKARTWAAGAQRSAATAAALREHADLMAGADNDIVRGEALRLYRMADEYDRDSVDSMKQALEYGWHEGLAQ